MENDIKVTIWCITYNHEKYLKECLDGFVKQKTNFKFEVIIHDDASTDLSQKIIKEYASKYPEIIKPILQYENKYNSGINYIDEYLLPNARGKYLAFCEGDDFWCDEHKLQLQYDSLENNKDCYLCSHVVQLINDDGTYKQNEFMPSLSQLKDLKLTNDLKILKPEDVLRNCINGNCAFHTTSFFVNFEKFKEYRHENPLFAQFAKDVKIEDVNLIYFLISHGNVVFLNKKMSCYRNNIKGSWTNKVAENNFNNDFFKKVIYAEFKMYLEYNRYTNYKYEKILINENNLVRKILGI